MCTLFIRIQKLCNYCERQYDILQKVNNTMTTGSQISTSRCIAKALKVGTGRDMYTLMSISALVMMAKMCKQPKCPSAYEQTKCGTHTTEYYSAQKRKEFLSHVTTQVHYDDILNEISPLCLINFIFYNRFIFTGKVWKKERVPIHSVPSFLFPSHIKQYISHK